MTLRRGKTFASVRARKSVFFFLAAAASRPAGRTGRRVASRRRRVLAIGRRIYVTHGLSSSSSGLTSPRPTRMVGDAGPVVWREERVATIFYPWNGGQTQKRIGLASDAFGWIGNALDASARVQRVECMFKRIIHANLRKSMGINASRWRRREPPRAEWKIEASPRLGRNRPGRCDL